MYIFEEQPLYILAIIIHNVVCSLIYDSLVWRQTLQWRHNERDGDSNHQPHNCLLNRLFRRRSKKTSKLRVTGLCAGISPVTGEFPGQMASHAENVFIWWRHHVYVRAPCIIPTRGHHATRMTMYPSFPRSLVCSIIHCMPRSMLHSD